MAQRGGAVEAGPQDPATGREETAFAAFVCEHRGGLLRAISRRIHRAEDAEDILQEALLRTWRRWGQLDSGQHRRNFAYTVAQRLTIDFRRVKVHQEHACAEFTDDMLGSAPCPSLALERRERHACLHRALLALPLAQRRLLVDAEMYGLTTEELQARHDAEAGTLRSRRYRAREALRRQLDRSGPAAVIPAAAGRVNGWWQAVTQRWHGAAEWLSAVSYQLTAAVTAISMLVGPFGILAGPGRGSMPDSPAPRWTSVREPVGRTTSVAMVGPVAPLSRGGNDVVRHAQPRESPSRLPAATRTRACVAGHCVSTGGGNDDPGDEVRIDLPAPIDDRYIKQSVVPVCDVIPKDTPSVSCERHP